MSAEDASSPPADTVELTEHLDPERLFGQEATVLLESTGELAARTEIARSGGTVAPTMILSPEEAAGAFPTLSTPPAAGEESTHSAAARRRYRLLGEAGRGGMGAVHIAKDLDLRRKVAFKELLPEAARSSELLGRFTKEVQITAQLDHPQIVPVYALEVTPQGAPAYTMKLVEGRTFKELIDEARAQESGAGKTDEAHALPRRLEHFLKVCDGVSYAHDKAVLHRDLKPQNLMLGRHNEVYVMDWGLAKLVGEAGRAQEPLADASVDLSASASDVTRVEGAFGTPRYMSPEQAAGQNRELDARSDQYALGLILFELILLRPANAASTLREILANALAGRTERCAAGPGERPVPPELAAIVARATAFRREERYASVAELADDLRSFLRGDAVSALRDTAWQRLGRSLARHRQLTATLLLGLVALLAVGAFGALWLRESEREARRRLEQRRAELASAVDTKGDAIEAHLQHIEGLVRSLAEVAVQALAHGDESGERFYWTEEFRDPRRQPPDLAASPRYEGRISALYPAWGVAPGVAPESVLPSIRRLVTLRHFRRRMLFESRPSVSGEAVPAAAPALLDDRELPLAITMLGLENGVLSVYPGSDTLPLEHDPRHQPWYRIASDNRGPRWGSAYRSSLGAGLVVPCSMALRDDEGGLLGVVGAQMTLDYVVSSLIGLGEIPAVVETLLLDPEDRVLVRARVGAAAPELAPESVQELVVYRDRIVVDALQRSRSGIAYSKDRGRDTVVAFDRIDPLGLGYVVVADAERLDAER